MPAMNSICAEKLFRLIGTPNCPAVIDVRSPEELRDDPFMIPASLIRPGAPPRLEAWAPQVGRPAVVVGADGKGAAPGIAAWARASGIKAELLDGGIAAWSELDLPLVPIAKLPRADGEAPTVWVSRARPKVDRIACPWLIRRFVDPGAIILFVAPSEVTSVAERLSAAPFDVEGAFWSHRAELCTFDVMVAELGLGGVEALRRLAVIVRGADTDRPDLAPQAAGLLAASLGLSRMYSEDVEQLEAGMLLYDAFYRWCRDAVDERHDWASHTPRKERRA